MLNKVEDVVFYTKTEAQNVLGMLIYKMNKYIDKYEKFNLIDVKDYLSTILLVEFEQKFSDANFVWDTTDNVFSINYKRCCGTYYITLNYEAALLEN